MSTHLSDEELVDRFKGFLKTYGGAILTGILIALIAFFGWQYWQKKQAVERYNLATQYQQVVDAGQRLTANPDNQVMRTQYFSKADALVKAHPDSAHALQAQFLSAKIAANKGDYVTAEKQLLAATKSQVEDDGLKQLVWLRLSYMQLAQRKYDAALTSLKSVTDAAFIPSANEAKGDILVQKNDLAGAKAAYQAAWDELVKREEPRQLLQVKLESLGVTVKDVVIEGPIRKPVEDPARVANQLPNQAPNQGASQAVAQAAASTDQPATPTPSASGE